jgi:hypothetical protein
MSIGTRVEELQRSTHRHPFITNLERDGWMEKWCDRCQGNQRPGGCVLLQIATRDQRMPDAWRLDQPTGIATRYTCQEWTPTLRPRTARPRGRRRR